MGNDAPPPKVSIVMPVYNGGAFFELAARSAVEQTYSNFEVIIVNDGSEDGGYTDRIARRFASAHSDKVRYISQHNQGVAGALNAGIEAMAGDLFCWLSHDDIYLPNKVESQVNFWLRLGRKDVILYGDWEYIDESGGLLYPIILSRSSLRGPSIAAVLGGAINGCTVMVPREALVEHRFDVKYRCVQDYRLWHELTKTCLFVRHPEILVRQRLHSGQDSNRLKDLAIREGEEFWREVIFETSDVLRAMMDGSSARFLRRMAKQLEEMPYPKIQSLTAIAAEAASAEPRISVVVLEGGRMPGSSNKTDRAAGAYEDAHQILRMPREASDDPALADRTLTKVLAEITGEYIIFTDLENCADWVFIKNQVLTMSELGALLSVRERVFEERLTDVRTYFINEPPAMSQLVFHRSLAMSGFLSSHDVDPSLSASAMRMLCSVEFLRLSPNGTQYV